MYLVGHQSNCADLFSEVEHVSSADEFLSFSGTAQIIGQFARVILLQCFPNEVYKLHLVNKCWCTYGVYLFKVNLSIMCNVPAVGGIVQKKSCWVVVENKFCWGLYLPFKQMLEALRQQALHTAVFALAALMQTGTGAGATCKAERKSDGSTEKQHPTGLCLSE